MDKPFDKENDKNNIISHILKPNKTPISPLLPLKCKKSMNSLSTSPSSALSSSVKIDSTSLSYKSEKEFNVINIQKEYDLLERHYADMLLNNNNLMKNYKQLEIYLEQKNNEIIEQERTIVNYEKLIKNIKNEHQKDKEIFEKEILYYKGLIETKQLEINKLKVELNKYKQENILSHEIKDKYERLVKEFKLLLINFELEKNSKLVLIDQIEFLSKENELISSQNMYNNDLNLKKIGNSLEKKIHKSEISNNCNNIIQSTTDKTINQITDYEDEKIIEMISYLDDDLRNTQLDESLEIGRNFQFPLNNQTHTENNNNSITISNITITTADSNSTTAINNNNTNNNNNINNNKNSITNNNNTTNDNNTTTTNNQTPNLDDNPIQFQSSPNLDTKDKKRKSLPVKLRTSIYLDQDNEFILSPLKLANNQYLNTYDDNSITKPKKRYSNSKPNHTRYNSHDIFPIKVEFEKVELSLRSTSVPENDHITKVGSIDSTTEYASSPRRSVRNSALFALNGYISHSSYRNSTTTTASSKHSSMIMENQIPNDMTKQEIMKLKFELQSLKLHNEKLLSYIGFELQNQKKNMKKLSTKKSLNNLSRKIEYSDAKLIEKSRNLLIHKERVLRSVSINPIVSKRYTSSNMGIITKSLLLPYTNKIIEKYISKFISNNDEDDYGFLNHNDQFCKRVFSNGLHAYLNYDYIDKNDIFKKEGNIKRYESQDFNNKSTLSCIDNDSDTIESEDSDWEDIHNGRILINQLHDGMFNHIKQLLLGSNVSSAKKGKIKNDLLVDDGLKYKFLTIAIGIMIIGFKLSHPNNTQ